MSNQTFKLSAAFPIINRKDRWGKDNAMVDSRNWNIETLRNFYDERLEENQRRSDERYSQLLEQMRVERDSIDKRFDQANRYKETYSQRLAEINNEAPKRVEVDTRLNAIQEKMDERIGSVQEKIDLVQTKQNKTDWPLYASFSTIVFVLLGALWTLIGQQIQVTTQPILVAMEQVKVSNESRDRASVDVRNDLTHLSQYINDSQASRNKDISILMQNTEAGKVDRGQLNERIRNIEGQVASSSQADANSKTDRSQLNDRVKGVESALGTELADRKSNEATLKSALVEVETQFCSADSIRNLSHASDLRIMSVLWQHANLGIYPTDNAFYPTVCRRTFDATKN